MSLARHWGTTEAERALAFPCDAFVERIVAACWRGVTVRARAAVIFRWLCQLKEAPYSYDWIDNWGRRSPQSLTPGLEQLEVGQRVMGIFDLVAFEPERSLTVRTRHRADGRLPTIAITYALRAGPPETTRLLAKLAIQTRPGLLYSLLTRALILGDLVMMRRQLLNLKGLAERSEAESAT